MTPYIKLVSAMLPLFLLNCSAEDAGGDGDWGFSPDDRQQRREPWYGQGAGQGQATQSGNFGAGQGTPVDLANRPEAPIDYPSSLFSGTGVLASQDPDNPIQAQIRQELSQTEIKNHTQRFTSSDDNVDEEVRKLVGVTTFLRTSKQELLNRERAGSFANATFLMFANRSTATSGFGTNETIYSKPLPILVIPTDMPQYNDLTRGPLIYDASMIDGAGERWNVVSTVTLVAQNGPTVKIRLLTEIQGNDRDGRLYDKMHPAHITDFEVDTQEKRVKRLYTRDYYHNERKGRRHFELQFGLCAYEVKGQVQNYPCPALSNAGNNDDDDDDDD